MLCALLHIGTTAGCHGMLPSPSCSIELERPKLNMPIRPLPPPPPPTSARTTSFPTAQLLPLLLQLGIVPFAGVDIAAFEILKEKLLHRYEGDPPPLAILGAGMLSSSIAQFASYPLALVRTRLQVGFLLLPVSLRLQQKQ